MRLFAVYSSFRSVVRTTNDLDLAVAVNDDTEAESIVRILIGLGYRTRDRREFNAHRDISGSNDTGHIASRIDRIEGSSREPKNSFKRPH